MNELAAVLRRQAASDIRALPARMRDRLSDSGRAARCGTVAELRDSARRALPRVVFDFLDGAAGEEATARRNRADLDAIELRPRVLVDVSEVNLATTVLGEPVALPLLGAPMGLLGLVHPHGEIALARALQRAGSLAVVGAMASYAIEDMGRELGAPMWFQTYLWRDRGLVAELLERARLAGCRALVLTVDVPRSAARHRDRRNGFGVPPRATLRSVAGAARRPRWTLRLVRDPRLQWANVASAGADPVSTTAYINEQFDPGAGWEDLAWLRERWPGPLAVKGILHAGDARQAVRMGADAVIVSNHGGRQLDHAPSSISALRPIVDAVAGEAEVLMDGGIRHGVDLLRALAYGARACLVGRPLAYGLGVAGEAGVSRAVEILREELRAALALCGCPSVTALDRSWVSPVPASAPVEAAG